MKWFGRRDSVDNGDAGCCERMRDLLSCYADGEITADERPRVEAHLRRCSACSHYLGFLERTTQVFQRIGDLDPPPALRATILAATVNRARIPFHRGLKRAFSRPLVRFGTLALSGAAFALLLAFLQSEPGSNRRSSSILSSMPVESPRGPALAAKPQIGGDPGQGAAESIPTDRQPDRAALAKPSGTASPRSPAIQTASLYQIPRAANAAVKRPDNRPRGQAIAHAVSQYKSKVTTTVPAGADPDPTVQPPDMPEMMPAIMMTVIPLPEGTPTSSPMDPASGKSSEPVRIRLVAASAPIPTAQIVTMTDLKRSLKAQADWIARDVTRGLRDKQIRVDLIRQTF